MVAAVALLLFSSPGSGQWSLNDGTKVSFIFVKPSEKAAWRPDGSPVSYADIPKPTQPVWSAKDEEPILSALINPPHRTAMPSVRFKLPATSELSATFTVPSSIPKIWFSGYRPTPGQPRQQDLAVGIANGPWTALGTVEYQQVGDGVHAVKAEGAAFSARVVAAASANSAGPFTAVEVTRLPSLDNVAYRVVALNRSGEAMPSVASYSVAGRKGAMNYTFEGDVKSVGSIELQTREYEWTTIRVAHFRPN